MTMPAIAPPLIPEDEDSLPEAVAEAGATILTVEDELDCEEWDDERCVLLEDVLEDVMILEELVEVRDVVDVDFGIDDDEEEVVDTDRSRTEDDYQSLLGHLDIERYSPTFDDESVVDVVLMTGAAVDETLTGVDVVTARACEVVTFGATAEVDGVRADVDCTGFADEVTTRAADVRTGVTAVVVVDIVLASPAVGAPARACSFGARRGLLEAMAMNIESLAGNY